MKAFKDLRKGDILYEVVSRELVSYEVTHNAFVGTASLRVPVKSKGTDEIFDMHLPKSKGGSIEYKFPGIYRGFYTNHQVAEEALRANLAKFKENAEAGVKKAQEELLKAQARLKKIDERLSNITR